MTRDSQRVNVMTIHEIRALIIRVVIALGLAAALSGAPASAQALKTTTRIVYHNGPVVQGSSAIYVIWYGCWSTGCAGAAGQDSYVATYIVPEFLTTLGSSPYFLINAGYTDSNGGGPSGGLVYVGAIRDSYSRGPSLSRADVGAIVNDHIASGALPLDATGIYLVLTSADVTVWDETTKFCVTCCQYHDVTYVNATPVTYAFVGNPRRCPTSCAAQFSGDHTPNGNLAADGMANWIAHALSGIVTNPMGSGWYDRYGLENSDKCEGLFGDTYTLDWNGSTANVQLGSRHYLLQQNWVNGRKGRCALTPF
jgi:hypothetical protein